MKAAPFLSFISNALAMPNGSAAGLKGDLNSVLPHADKPSMPDPCIMEDGVSIVIKWNGRAG